MNTRFVVIGCTPHVARAARDLPPDWGFSATLDAITGETQMAFFIHWRTRVPAEILRRTECVGFHAAALPQGRGGSPVQNQIVAGVEHTVLTAFRMTEEIDAGPIYGVSPLCLAGSADEIYARIAQAAINMAMKIAVARPTPVPQTGEARQWARRTPSDSALPTDADLRRAFDHIRMLDAEGYPRAFVRHGRLCLTFSRVAWRGDRIVADVEIAT